MTIASRGAVAPTSDQGGTGADGSPAALAPPDAAAIDALVDEVADHAAIVGRDGRRGTLRSPAAGHQRHHGWPRTAGWTRPVPPRGSSPARPRPERSSSPASGRSCAWPACSATRSATSPRSGKPSFSGPVREAPDGRLRVQVFPDGAFDRITFPQTTAEVWMQPGVTRESLTLGQAARLCRPGRACRDGAGTGRGQRRLARPARRPFQALRGGQGRRHEGEPGQRLPRSPLEQRHGVVDRRRCAAHRGGRCRGRAAPDRAPAHRRGAHHRFGQDLRRRRVRRRARRGNSGRRQTSRCSTSR